MCTLFFSTIKKYILQHYEFQLNAELILYDTVLEAICRHEICRWLDIYFQEFLA